MLHLCLLSMEYSYSSAVFLKDTFLCDNYTALHLSIGISMWLAPAVRQILQKFLQFSWNILPWIEESFHSMQNIMIQDNHYLLIWLMVRNWYQDVTFIVLFTYFIRFCHHSITGLTYFENSKFLKKYWNLRKFQKFLIWTEQIPEKK